MIRKGKLLFCLEIAYAQTHNQIEDVSYCRRLYPPGGHEPLLVRQEQLASPGHTPHLSGHKHARYSDASAHRDQLCPQPDAATVHTHCNNENAAALLVRGIRAKWPQAEVLVHPCGGLCSFYAQDQGLILTY